MKFNFPWISFTLPYHQVCLIKIDFAHRTCSVNNKLETLNLAPYNGSANSNGFQNIHCVFPVGYLMIINYFRQTNPEYHMRPRPLESTIALGFRLSAARFGSWIEFECLQYCGIPLLKILSKISLSATCNSTICFPTSYYYIFTR